MKEYWPFVLFGLVILSILFGVGKKEQEQSQFDMGMEMPPMGPGGMY